MVLRAHFGRTFLALGARVSHDHLCDNVRETNEINWLSLSLSGRARARSNRHRHRLDRDLGQTRRAAQVPQLQLLNATFVSVPAANHGEPKGSSQARTEPTRIKLDCRAQGYPAPWIEWYKNGRLLRNKPNGRLSTRTSRWRRKQNARLSRLELLLEPGRNETGVYECRAMNVVAREPAVGAYTLLVLPAQYALVPMQPELVARQPVESAPAPTARGPPTSERPSSAPTSQPSSASPANETSNSIQQEWPEKGQPCPREAHDNFCMNKGTCVLIGHIEEYYCK